LIENWKLKIKNYMTTNLEIFEQKAGIEFRDKQLLQTAFTHRSYLNEHRGSLIEHNERLEFLGDAVLELVVTEFLYKKYPKKPEGELTSLRSALVNFVTLAGVAENLDMNDYMLLSKGEKKDTGRAREVILANAIEALIGAIYLDGGYESAERFISKNILTLTEKIIREGKWIDAKSKFQEKAQEETGITPRYETVGETGPDHDKHFRVAVFLGKEKIAEGEGKSKQEAEQDAASAALAME
jgi:ribonuclease-3